MKRSAVLLIFFFLFEFFLSAQRVWYFGNGAGLDFASGSPEPVFGSKLFTLEGCASACDETGKLLFYTDGVTVWTRSHHEMQNGTGLNGSQSSTQAALIVPKPGTKDLYFIFTTDEKGGSKGLCYSLVDLSGGEGVVAKKNIPVLAPVAEKLTLARWPRGKGFWLITHQWNSNNFYSFPVTAQGVGKPVISSCGNVHAETGSGENREAIGCLSVSPNEKRIASVVCYRPKNNLEIFDFDNSSGKISNTIAVTLNGSPYGLSFSPDNSKLYVSFLKGKSGIVQYSLNDGQVTEVTFSKKDNSFGTLKLGPGGKIYVARSEDFLDVIHEPNNSPPRCRYERVAVDLSPVTSNFGLPNVFMTIQQLEAIPTENMSESGNAVPPASAGSGAFDCTRIIQRPFSNKDQMVTTDISVCEEEYLLSAKNFGASFTWSTMESTQKIKVKTSGMYRVSISKEGCTVSDSVRIRFRKEDAVFTFLPSFNPEAEFLNGEFYYEVEDVHDFELKVYDKHKNVLFETTNLKKKWNGKNPKGKIVAAGEYFWSAKFTPNCPKESKPEVKYGKVMVKRDKK